MQKTLKRQNLPQSPQHHLHGLSHPRALRACSQQDLSLAAWNGPQSRTVHGRRPAWTTPMRSLGSPLSSVASPGQAGEEGIGESAGWVQRARVAQTGDVGGGGDRSLLSCEMLEVWELVVFWGADTLPCSLWGSLSLESLNKDVAVTDLSSIRLQQPSHHSSGSAQSLQPVAAGSCLLPRGPHPKCSWTAAGPHQCPSHP